MSYHLGTDNADEQSAQQNDILPDMMKPPEQPMLPPPIVPGPSDITPLTPLVPMGAQKGLVEKFFEKLEETGPLGFTWKFWGYGALVAAGLKYMSKSSTVTPNRKRRKR